MRTFIQLKDGIGWACVNTTSEVPNAIEVDSGTGDFFIKKKYENGLWSEADIIKFAEINDEGTIIEVRRTFFPSDVSGPVMEFDTKTTALWRDNAWYNPTEDVIVSPQIRSEESNVEEERN